MNFNNSSCLTIWAQNVLISPDQNMSQWEKCFNTPKLYTTAVSGQSNVLEKGNLLILSIKAKKNRSLKTQLLIGNYI